MWWIFGGVIVTIAVVSIVVAIGTSMHSSDDDAAYQKGYSAGEYDYQHGGANQLQSGIPAESLCESDGLSAVQAGTFPANDNGGFRRGCMAAMASHGYH